MSILIRDAKMPDECWECKLNANLSCAVNGEVIALRGRLPNCPLVELPEIIRCKDCANRCTNDCPMFFEEWVEWEEDGYIECDDIGHDHTEDNYFCSCAKRKEI